MPMEVVSNVYANIGLFGLIVVAFFALVIYVVKSSEKREAKLHQIIDVLTGTLTQDLPEMRKTLEEIKNKVMRN